MEAFAERPAVPELVEVTVIVDFGLGSKVLKMAKPHGVMYGFILLGMGTLRNKMLEFLQLADIRKEIVVMVAEKNAIDIVMDAVNDRFQFDKPFHGIAYTKPLRALCGGGETTYIRQADEEGEGMYQSIIVVVDRGKAEEVMEAATKAGARGGTIIKARGAGEYGQGKLFHMDIEPEKELVLILSSSESAGEITDALREALKIGGDGNGVILCQDVSKTYGVK